MTDDQLDRRLTELENALADMKETLFLRETDLRRFGTENIAMRSFIQNLYESCDGLQDMEELSLKDVLENLKENIRVFARDHNIRL